MWPRRAGHACAPDAPRDPRAPCMPHAPAAPVAPRSGHAQSVPGASAHMAVHSAPTTLVENQCAIAAGWPS
eukprot:9490284-Pyramimonas_sp.AAC.1